MLKIKKERLSFSEAEESGSEEESSRNIPPSKIKIEAKQSADENDDTDDDEADADGEEASKDEPESDSDEETNLEALEAMLKEMSFPETMKIQLKQHFKEFSNIKPLPEAKSSVDIDLTNPDEDMWIIQCPANIDVKSELLNKKINFSAPKSRIRHCSTFLEANVEQNTSEKVLGLMCGRQIKSFVPTGFVRITEAQAKTKIETPVPEESNHVEVPFPENIRQRHPLLGYDFQETMEVSDRVKERLSNARKKADLFYTTSPPKVVEKSKSKKHKHKLPPTVNVKVEPSDESASETELPTKSKKHKDSFLPTKMINQEKAVTSLEKKSKRSEAVDTFLPPELIKQEIVEAHPKNKSKRSEVVDEFLSPELIKQEKEASPKKKSKRSKAGEQPDSIKKELPVEDDISWLMNI